MRSVDSAYHTKWWQDIPLIGLGLAFLIALGGMISVSSIRDLTQLENILFQIVTLATGLLGSYRFGRNAAKAAAYDVIRPHARASIRRILSLRDSLFRLSEWIEDYKTEGSFDYRLNVIQAIVNEQIPTGGSAVEDWRDIVPDDVDEILGSWPVRWGVEQNGNTE